MDLISALETSGSGLYAQSERMKVIASNLANANTTRTEEGGPYRRKDIVFTAVGPGSSFESVLRSRMESQPCRVKVAGVVEDPRPPRTVYDPSHPDANAEGYVALPNINVMEEMVNMMLATRSYEANIMAINAAKGMAHKALTIGSGR